MDEKSFNELMNSKDQSIRNMAVLRMIFGNEDDSAPIDRYKNRPYDHGVKWSRRFHYPENEESHL